MVWKSCRNGTSIEIMFLSLEKKKKKTTEKENTATIHNNKRNKNGNTY